LSFTIATTRGQSFSLAAAIAIDELNNTSDYETSSSTASQSVRFVLTYSPIWAVVGPSMPGEGGKDDDDDDDDLLIPIISNQKDDEQATTPV